MRSPAERRSRNGLFAASVVFLHFQLVDASGYPVSLGSIFGCTLLLSLVKWQMRPSLICGCALWILQAFVVLSTEPVLTTTSQFLRTLVQSLAAVTMLVVALTADQRSRHDFAPAARLLLWGLAALGGVQFITARAGSGQLYNLWGSHQYLYDYQIMTGNAARATGVYLEPAFYALVVCALAAVAVTSDLRAISVLSPAALAVYFSQSACGLVGLVVVALFAGLQSGQSRAWGKRRQARVATVVLVMSALLFVGADYLLRRVTSGSIEGSSTYYRFVAPRELLAEVLTHHPLGLPLGSLERVIPSYDMSNGGRVGSSLDNGLYLLIYYAGWIGVILILGLLFFVLRYTFAPGRQGLRLIPICLLLFLQFTGAVLTVEFAIVMIWVSLQCRSRVSSADPAEQMKLTPSTGDEPLAPVEHRHHHA